ncbi:MAG: histidinol-phosphate transaminase [Neisseria sp.]|nr:histidinol-phosphate transaminase [Neisseria sp.]
MNTLTDIIRPDIQAMQAYPVAALPQGCLKLDAMESPYDFPPAMQQELGARLVQAPIRLYPNIATDDFIPQLKTTFAIPDAAHVVLGNGSDELIQLLTMLVAQPNATIMGIEPTFVMYRHNAALYGMPYVSVDANADLSLNLERTLQAIAEHQPALLFLAYPNNPTGTRYPREAVEQIIAAAPGLVVIDEAYGAFSADSFLPQAGSQDKLLVLRTFSKIGFAGLRLGYLSGSLNVIEHLRKIVPPYNMNQLTLTAAKYALQHNDWVQENVTRLKMEREILFAALEDIEAIKVFPSEANFLTVRVPDAAACFEAFLQHKMLIKKLHGMHPLLAQCVRITIGRPEDNVRIAGVLRQLYA